MLALFPHFYNQHASFCLYLYAISITGNSRNISAVMSWLSYNLCLIFSHRKCTSDTQLSHFVTIIK